MIDSKIINDLIEQQIKQSVEQQVSAQMKDRDLVEELQKDLIAHARDRITARFANISDMPDLISTVQSSVKNLLQNGHLPEIKSYVDVDQLKMQIDHKVESLVESMIDNLVLDQAWIEKIETQINRLFALKFSERLSLMDINSIVGDHIELGIDKWRTKLLEDFRTNGLCDQADTTELTLVPGGVTVENTLVSRDAVIGGDAEVNGNLTVNNLILKGSVNVDNRSWNELTQHISDLANASLTKDWADTLKQQVVEMIQKEGIDFPSVKIDGRPLVDGTVLSESIRDTSIEQLGTLRNLTVSGTAVLTDTLKVNSKRVGINTETPDMALSVWDEEISVSVGKLSKNLAYIGTSRLQNLAIGINRGRQIEIDADGLVTVNKLKIGHFRIGHESKVPGYSGARGDIVFNSDPRPGEPFAWQCLGSFQWQPLKAMA